METLRDNAVRVKRFRELKATLRTNRERLLVGIDVAQAAHVVHLRHAHTRVVTRLLTIPTTTRGFTQLWAAIQRAQRTTGCREVVCGLEPTGVYHLAVAAFLEHQGADVLLLSSSVAMSSIYMMEKDFDKAISEAKKAIEKAPKNIEAYLHLANLYLLKKDLVQAEKTYQEAVKVDEKATRARYALAEFYLRTGKTEWAESELIELTKINPKDSNPYITLGNFYGSLKRMEDAERQFQKAIEVDPKRIAAQIHLGDFYLFWGKKEKAIATFQKAIDSDSKNIPARVKLAEIYLNDNHFDKASEAIGKILAVPS